MTDSKPLFSLLLPVKNSLPYLRDQVESIQAQKATDFEVVVVDGNSSDGSFEYLQEVAARDPRFKLHRTAPRGVYAGLNECCRRSVGKWILFTMSDDTLKPGALEGIAKEIPNADRLGARILHWNIDLIDAQGGVMQPGWRRMQAPRYWGGWLDRRHLRDGEEEYWRHILSGSVYISLTEIAVRRDALEKVGGFLETVGNWADIYWGAQVVRGGKILHVPATYATWRLRPGQTTEIGKSGKLTNNHLKLIKLAERNDANASHRERYRRYRRASMFISKQGGHLRYGSLVRVTAAGKLKIMLMRVAAAIARKSGMSDIDFRLLAFRRILPPSRGTRTVA